MRRLRGTWPVGRQTVSEKSWGRFELLIDILPLAERIGALVQELLVLGWWKEEKAAARPVPESWERKPFVCRVG